jgi:hypothetical protein
MKLLALLLGVLALGAGCGDSGSSAPDAFFSICGQPGDPGNEIGVGQYCEAIGDCITTQNAPLCSRAGDSTTFFCTNTCNVESDAGPSSCGTGATCTCGNGGCGCTPDVCLD